MKIWTMRPPPDVLVAALCLLLIGCGEDRPRRIAQPVRSAAEITLPPGLPSARARYNVRDVLTDQRVAVEDRGGLLVLSAGGRVIDTLTGSPLGEGVTDRRSESISDALLRFDSQPTGGPLELDLVLVADGRLVVAAEMPSWLRLPRDVLDTTYRTTFAVDPDGLTIRGVESWRFDADERPELKGAWDRPFTLTFEENSRVFHNAMVRLDSVPVEGTGRTVSDTVPAIALAAGTRVFVDGSWYALSLPDDLDFEEFALGTSGLVLEGRGAFKDTLRAVR